MFPHLIRASILGALTHLDDLCLSLAVCVDHLCSSILGALTHHNGRGGQCTMKCSAPTVLFRHNGLKMFVTQATMASQSGHLGYLLLLIHQTSIVSTFNFPENIFAVMKTMRVFTFLSFLQNKCTLERLG